METKRSRLQIAALIITQILIMFIFELVGSPVHNAAADEARVAALTTQVESMRKELREIKQTKLVFKVTKYTASKAECDSTPNRTAIMKKPIVGRTVAVSHDYAHMLGKSVWIEGIGVFVVEDLMSKKHKKTIDILTASKADAKKFGRQDRRVVFFEG